MAARPRACIRFTDQEILLILRAYVEMPSQWRGILASVKDNVHLLAENARNYYNTTAPAVLISRIRMKTGNLLKTDVATIENADIR